MACWRSVSPGVCGTRTGNSTLNHMMHSSIPMQSRRSRLSGSGNIFRPLPLIVFAACVALSVSLCASAKEAKGFAPATLVEAANYLPCGDGCSALSDPASAFASGRAIRFLSEKGKLLHEGKFSSLEELAGKQFQVRFNGRHLWMRPPGGATVKSSAAPASRTSRTPDASGRCAGRFLRPRMLISGRKVPAYAFALAARAKAICISGSMRSGPHASVIAAASGMRTATSSARIGTVRGRRMARRFPRTLKLIASQSGREAGSEVGRCRAGGPPGKNQ